MERRFINTRASLSIERRGTDPPMIVGLGSVFYNAADPGTEFQLAEDMVSA